MSAYFERSMAEDDPSPGSSAAPRAGLYPCPTCGQAAVPLSVTTQGPAKIVVHLRCERCQREFDAERRTQTLFEKG